MVALPCGEKYNVKYCQYCYYSDKCVKENSKTLTRAELIKINNSKREAKWAT